MCLLPAQRPSRNEQEDEHDEQQHLRTAGRRTQRGSTSSYLMAADRSLCMPNRDSMQVLHWTHPSTAT